MEAPLEVNVTVTSSVIPVPAISLEELTPEEWEDYAKAFTAEEARARLQELLNEAAS